MVERNDGLWPAEKILVVIENGVNGFNHVVSRIRERFSLPRSDEFSNSLDQSLIDRNVKLPGSENSEAQTNLTQLMARMAAYGGDRFHTPYQ